jgi:hypothetical protein
MQGGESAISHPVAALGHIQSPARIVEALKLTPFVNARPQRKAVIKVGQSRFPSFSHPGNAASGSS